MAGPLSALARLEAREQGAALHPTDQALMVLRLADPTAAEALPLLPIAERDRRLLACRRATFGDSLPCLVECPACGATQEFALSAAALAAGLEECPPETLEADGWRIGLRALGSVDLAATAGAATAEHATAMLVACAVGEAIDPAGNRAESLPDALWRRVAARVAEREATAEIALDLACVACGAGWTAGFDIGPHFWAEIEADARRRLADVAALAARFGWSEEALLAMPASRRRAYLDLAGAA